MHAFIKILLVWSIKIVVFGSVVAFTKTHLFYGSFAEFLMGAITLSFCRRAFHHLHHNRIFKEVFIEWVIKNLAQVNNNNNNNNNNNLFLIRRKFTSAHDQMRLTMRLIFVC